MRWHRGHAAGRGGGPDRRTRCPLRASRISLSPQMAGRRSVDVGQCHLDASGHLRLRTAAAPPDAPHDGHRHSPLLGVDEKMLSAMRRAAMSPLWIAQLRAYRGPLREISEGDTIMRKIALDPSALAALPALGTLLRSKEWRGLI